jgi:hypothetical protein
LKAERRSEQAFEFAVIALEPVVQILGLPMLKLPGDHAILLQLGDRLAMAAFLSVLMTCGVQSRLRFKAAPRKRLAAFVLHRWAR